MFADSVIRNTRLATMLVIAELGCAMIWTRAGRAGEGVSS